MRKTSKDRQTAHMAQERARQTGYEKMLTGPRAAEVASGGEVDRVISYASGKHMVEQIRGEETMMDKVNLFDVRKECQICGKRYRADSKQMFCSCGGFLYITGAYWQRKTGGDADGQADTGAVHRRL